MSHEPHTSQQPFPESSPEPKPRGDSEDPAWIPKWMGERERAAGIIALGMVASAAVLIVGAFILLLAAGIIR